MMVVLQRLWNLLTVLVSNVHLFDVLFASLCLGLERAGLGLGTAGLDYKTGKNKSEPP